VVLFASTAFGQSRLTRFVDPFIGTGGHGHTFPGATRPFGMVQLSPDTRLEGWDGCSGYHYSDSVVYGFSHTHLSGTGISDYGDILLMPTAGEVFLHALENGRTERGYASLFNHRNEAASPGYYRVLLEDEKIDVELTATDRVGMHRYTYPANMEANVVLDLVHRDKVLDSELRVVSSTRIEGFRRSTGWARDQRLYFVAEFSRAFKAFGIAVDGRSRPELKEARGTDIKSYFRFDSTSGAPVLVRIALSPVSVEGARANLAAELSHWDFERVRREADAAWNRELGKLHVRGGTPSQMKNFYTALYHSMIAPNLFSDVDGRYRGLDGKIHNAEDFSYYTVFSLWDTFRAAHPLYSIIDQRRSRDFIKTFLAQHQQGGRLPVWELAANETDTMIGYHAVSVIADAVAKGVGGFNLEDAYEAMKHSANLNHFGLASYKQRGFISSEDEPESVSKTLEYAYDDWCIAMVAGRLGRHEDYREFMRRAQYYKNLFDAETRFIRAKKNGNWLEPFDPREVNFSFTEANAWQYTFFAPQDISGLIKMMGGKENFVRRLDELFTADSRTTGRQQADITGLIGQYAHGNEPSHHMAYLYNFVGQPWKTQMRVRQILEEFYRATPDGLIGNEDCGQMSAWYVLSASGFYPVTPGSPIYIIGAPLFREIRLNLENGKTFVVKAPGVSSNNVYVQAVKLNGKPLERSYFTHAEIASGGELIFQMGPQPNRQWGTANGNLPISEISEEAIVPVPVIRASGETFRGELTVTMKASSPLHKIVYAADVIKIDNKAGIYSGPFVINKPTTIQALAFDEKGVQSFPVTARFHRIPHDWKIRLHSKYAPQYSAGGELALIDGLRGGPNFRTGTWQGFQGQNLEAVVDLGKLGRVTSVGVGFLQDMRSWILFPRRVEIELSNDGVIYEKVATIENTIPDRSDEVMVRNFQQNVPAREARYVRVRALNYGSLPSWHPGAGGQAWIFVDEIMIN
jgi:predicted alpha-1,2-mannosidase